MKPIRIISSSEQVAQHLREEMLLGSFGELMPGAAQLTSELGVGKNTVEAALKELENEGLLVNQGNRRRRRIVLPDVKNPTPMRIGILAYDEESKSSRLLIEMFHSLTEQGHIVFVPSKTLEDLRMNVKRVSTLVKKAKADAWIIAAGSREVNEWFVKENIPAFAVFGVQSKIPIAGTGPDHETALREVVRCLVQLGHRRIVSLCSRGEHVLGPNQTERVFLEELEAQGLMTGEYNLPSWDDEGDGFQRRLESLFGVTPPTALVVEEPAYFIATLQFCAHRQLRVPADVSVICAEYAASFAEADPNISHIHWDYKPMVRRIAKWADNVARGKKDLRQTRIKAEFIKGGTIGPAPVS